MSRPEHQAPPEYYYDEKEASKYTCNSRIIEVQTELAERALELLALPDCETFMGYAAQLRKAMTTPDADMLLRGSEQSNVSGDTDSEAMSAEDASAAGDSEATDDTDTLLEDESEGEDEDESESESESQKAVDFAARSRKKSAALKTPYFILDIGVGSGLCASVLEAHGHVWAGLDISQSMLDVAQARQREHELGPGDLLLSDMGQGIPLRPGVFDGAVSISALQWLCNADKRSHSPRSRLTRLFSTLYACLRHGARAVFQFYPENSAQIDMVLESSLKVGFTGGLVIDFPNSSKRKKYFLCLIAGSAFAASLPKAKSDSDNEDDAGKHAQIRTQGQHVKVKGGSSARVGKAAKKRKGVKDRDWVLRKKEVRRKRGYDVPEDTKFTARKRRIRF